MLGLIFGLTAATVVSSEVLSGITQDKWPLCHKVASALGINAEHQEPKTESEIERHNQLVSEKKW